MLVEATRRVEWGKTKEQRGLWLFQQNLLSLPPFELSFILVSRVKGETGSIRERTVSTASRGYTLT